MRDRLARYGICSTASALGTALTTQGAVTAPSGTTASIVQVARAHTGGTTAAFGFLQGLMGTKTTFGAVAVLAASGLVSVPAIGIAIHKLHAAKAADAEIIAASRAREAQLQQLQQLKEHVGQNAPQRAAIQTLLNQAHATAARATTTATTAGPTTTATYASTPGRGDRAAFLAAYPQVRPLLLEAGRQRTDPKLLAILRSGMTPEQVDAFNTRMWIERIDSLKATPDLGLGWIVSGLPSPDELRPLIGESGVAAITAWGKLAEVDTAAASIAAAVALADRPLSPAQVDTLTHAMYTAKPSAALAPGSPDWEAAFGALKAQLNPQQWRAAENGVARVGFPRLLNFLQQHARDNVVHESDQAAVTP